jgi:hypothetical protein
MHSRLFLLLAGFGLFTACGKDEAVAPLIVDGKPDAGEGSESTTSAPTLPVGPTSSAAVSPTGTPVSPGPATSKLAAACAGDAECGSGMKCLTSSGAGLFGGGPANGFCTVDCAADPNICASVQNGATCIEAGVDTICFPGCTPGGASATKCQGRPDVACDYVSIDVPFCRPMCRTDADCDGRKCSIGNGVCIDELPGAGDIGAACDPSIRPSTQCLSGFCKRGTTPATENSGTCSGLCTLGTDGCGVTGEPEAGQGWCAPFELGSTAGDMGVCSQQCECDDHCSDENYSCLLLPQATVEAYGGPGFCAAFDTDTTTLAEGFLLGKACQARDDAGADGGDADADATTSNAVGDAASDDAGDAMSLPVDSSTLEDSGDAARDAN